MTNSGRRMIEKVSSAINVEGPQIKPKIVLVERQLEQWFNSHFAGKAMAWLTSSDVLARRTTCGTLRLTFDCVTRQRRESSP